MTKIKNIKRAISVPKDRKVIVISKKFIIKKENK